MRHHDMVVRESKETLKLKIRTVGLKIRHWEMVGVVADKMVFRGPKRNLVAGDPNCRAKD